MFRDLKLMFHSRVQRIDYRDNGARFTRMGPVLRPKLYKSKLPKKNIPSYYRLTEVDV